jgi:predicted O-methyltransferase YrrM
MILQTNPIVAIDDNHVQLIKSLVMCNKPKTILEIGIGSGIVTKAVIDASRYNNISTFITCVDNFLDWGGKPPVGLVDLLNECTSFVRSNEKDFIYSTAEKYDFIVSDADHQHTHEWVSKTYDLLNTGGILIYHDVTNKEYPNLYEIVRYVQRYNINHVLLNRSSLPNERCERGLLVIFK